MTKNNYLVVGIAALSMLLGGCGNSEEPKTAKSDEPALQGETSAAAESAQPAETMAKETGETASEPMAAADAADQAPAAVEESSAQTTEQGAAPAEETAVAQVADGGKQAYGKICFACHTAGVAGAPKLGDKAVWEPRIAQGMDTLISHAINGFQGKTGAMPPKGGLPSMSDEDVAAAVSYMVEQAK